MKEKVYRPKSGYEGVRVSASLPDREKQLVIASWPYSSEDAAEQAVLDRHPYLTDRPGPKGDKEGEK